MHELQRAAGFPFVLTYVLNSTVDDVITVANRTVLTT